MRFTFNEEMSKRVDNVVRVGDVYPAKGGNRGAVYWVVIAVSGDWKSVKVLGIDRGGEIVSVASYNGHSLQDRPKVGFAKGLEDLEFNIEEIHL